MQFKNTFNKELPQDPIEENSRRQVTKACFSLVQPKKPSSPKLLHKTKEVAKLLGIDLSNEEFLSVFSGQKVIESSSPYAMCYGGHQFGSWAGQLGDGRAINIGEVNHNQQQWALQLKGAGETPYSRTADGLAVLRSSIREYVCAEAMHYLGVPTTRSLSLITSGDMVMRDALYNGNPALEKGAIVCRVAPSFIRFGSFQIFTSRQDHQTLKTLADYTIKHFYPEIKDTSPHKYVLFFEQVANKTLKMVIEWQRVGFVHGVMNTDNMSILGLTIDYGPYGWLEEYDPNWTPNTTDRQNRRYRFGQQPQVALWNLLQLANTLYPLVNESAPFEEVLDQFNTSSEIGLLQMMKQKLGLVTNKDTDAKLIESLMALLEETKTDYTLFFRKLSNFNLDTDHKEFLKECSYSIETPNLDAWQQWFSDYLGRRDLENHNFKASMDKVNPKYIFRNYMAQMVIDQANEENHQLLNEIIELLKNPYDEQPEQEKWFAKRPEWANGTSMLSCSS